MNKNATASTRAHMISDLQKIKFIAEIYWFLPVNPWNQSVFAKFTGQSKDMFRT